MLLATFYFSHRPPRPLFKTEDLLQTGDEVFNSCPDKKPLAVASCLVREIILFHGVSVFHVVSLIGGSSVDSGFFYLLSVSCSLNFLSYTEE